MVVEWSNCSRMRVKSKWNRGCNHCMSKSLKSLIAMLMQWIPFQLMHQSTYNWNLFTPWTMCKQVVRCQATQQRQLLLLSIQLMTRFISWWWKHCQSLTPVCIHFARVKWSVADSFYSFRTISSAYSRLPSLTQKYILYMVAYKWKSRDNCNTKERVLRTRTVLHSRLFTEC